MKLRNLFIGAGAALLGSLAVSSAANASCVIKAQVDGKWKTVSEATYPSTFASSDCKRDLRAAARSLPAGTRLMKRFECNSFDSECRGDGKPTYSNATGGKRRASYEGGSEYRGGSLKDTGRAERVAYKPANRDCFGGFNYR